MNWEKGDKAICDDDAGFPPLNYFPNGPVEKGKIYTVEGFTHHKSLGLILRESPGYDKDMEPVGFRATRFRKVESTEDKQVEED